MSDNKIILKKSSVPEKIPQPSDLEFGEVALNFADGKLYYKNSENEIEYFSTVSADGISSIGELKSFLFIATSGQDTFTGSDTNTNTLAYSVDFIEVFVNGVRLNPRDYTATDGQSVVLATPVNTGDEVAIVSSEPGFLLNATSRRQTFTANQDQTTFVIDDGYDPGFADVYLNGVKLINGVDVDISSGTEIVLTESADEDDSVDVVAYGSFAVADHYTKAESDALMQAAIDEVVDTKAETDFFTATVSGSNGTSDWVQASSSDPWIATITVNGILSTDRPIIDIDLSGVAFGQVGNVQNGWRDVYRVEASDDDEIKLYALAEPEVSFDLLIKVVR